MLTIFSIIDFSAIITITHHHLLPLRITIGQQILRDFFLSDLFPLILPCSWTPFTQVTIVICCIHERVTGQHRAAWQEASQHCAAVNTIITPLWPYEILSLPKEEHLNVILGIQKPLICYQTFNYLVSCNSYKNNQRNILGWTEFSYFIFYTDLQFTLEQKRELHWLLWLS